MRTFAAAALTPPPFPTRINAHVAEVGERSARWAADLGLVSTPDGVRRLAAANAADLAGRACPDADPDRLALLTDLITWLFAFDDACDDDGLGADPATLAPVIARLVEVLDVVGDEPSAGPPAEAGPVDAALHDLNRRLRALDRPSLLLRFAKEMRDYLLAMLWEAGNRDHRRIPPVAEYVQMRRHTGAVNPSLTLTDLAYGVEPAAGHLADPRLSRLDLLAVDLVCWCNDIFSYDKERRYGSNGQNLVVAIRAETGSTEEAALTGAATRFNGALTMYLELERAVLAIADPQVALFAAARRSWIRGTYDWSMAATRYH